MASSRIEITDPGVQKALDRVVRAGRDPKPILEDIGEYLLLSTKRRFATSTAPDGSKWAPNTQVTILQYLRVKSGTYSKSGKRTGDKDGYLYKKGANKGRLAAKGIDAVTRKKPLIGDTGVLSSDIFWQLDGTDGLLLGSPMKYAAAQQFGMPKGYAGTDKRGRSIPWGDVPARPFLGISEQDSLSILDIIEEHYLGP